MGLTTEGSQKFDFVCLSFGKDKERGLRVGHGASKESRFNEEVVIKAEKGILRDNNTLQSENGTIYRFNEDAFNTVKENRRQRKTERTDREIR